MSLQETHSAVNDEIKWKDDFKGEVSYSHGPLDETHLDAVSGLI